NLCCSATFSPCRRDSATGRTGKPVKGLMMKSISLFHLVPECDMKIRCELQIKSINLHGAPLNLFATVSWESSCALLALPHE
ncbi:hypothetical protein AVEN_164074-1, partial [Araneus ventricosus]